jgi:putative ABC transport system ATP-binding protein
MAPLIEMRGLSKVCVSAAGPVQILCDIDLKIERGEFVTVIGPSGSGKSTLMHIAGCLDRASAGAYRLTGRDVCTRSDRELAHIRNNQIGFVFQNFNLLPRLTNAANVALPLVYRGLSRAERDSRARELLGLVGLGDKASLYPHQISGGEQQRVAIARALISEPTMLLADEPTGNLDSHTGAAVLELFSQAHACGKTVIMVTHDPALARRATRLIRIVDGRIEHDGAPREAA